MAEPQVTEPVVVAVRDRWRPYRVVLASRIASQRSYRANFRLDLATSVLTAFIELAEVLVLFRVVDALGGLTLQQVLLVFGLADTAFALGSTLVGHVDELPRFIRTGTLDVFYLRPQPLLAQVISSDIQLRKLARAGVSGGVLVVALFVSDVPATPRSAVLVVLSLVGGTAIFAAQYVAAGGLQFFIVNGAEMTNSFVYGGRYAATQPAAVWARPVRALFGFVFPMAFCAYLPALAIFGLPGPALLPAWLAWCLPLAAVWAWAAAMACWRWGTRHYQGAGG